MLKPRIAYAFSLILLIPSLALAQPQGAARRADAIPSIYWDDAGGRLFMEIPKLDTEVLHSTGFGTGLGSNDIGIDRGALSGSRIVKFERVGPRLLMVQPNYQYRGTSSNAAEVRDVTEAFARSVLWAFQIAGASDGPVASTTPPGAGLGGPAAILISKLPLTKAVDGAGFWLVVDVVV